MPDLSIEKFKFVLKKVIRKDISQSLSSTTRTLALRGDYGLRRGNKLNLILICETQNQITDDET